MQIQGPYLQSDGYSSERRHSNEDTKHQIRFQGVSFGIELSANLEQLRECAVVWF